MEPGESLLLPAGPQAARLARARVGRLLADWGLTRLCDTALLLTSELVTNVVLHTDGAPSLTVVRSGGGVRVTVSDGSPVQPVRRRHSSSATTGRGVALLDDLADEWGVDRHPDGPGKAVWFVVSGDRDPWAAYDLDLQEL